MEKKFSQIKVPIRRRMNELTILKGSLFLFTVFLLILAFTPV